MMLMLPAQIRTGTTNITRNQLDHTPNCLFLGYKSGFVMYTVSIYEQNVSNKESSRYAGPSLLQAAKQQKRRKARDLTNL